MIKIITTYAKDNHLYCYDIMLFKINAYNVIV